MTFEDAIEVCSIIAILRGIKPSEVVAVGNALYDAGVRVVEVPLNSPDPFVSIAALTDQFRGKMVIGAGTVLGKVTATGKYVASSVAASDGSEVPAAVAIYGADASASDVTVSAIVRDAEVNGNCLTYHADRDQPAEKAAAHAALANLGVIVR